MRPMKTFVLAAIAVSMMVAIPRAEAAPKKKYHFELTKVQEAHARSRCRDLNGTEPWACGDCDCSARLEERLCSKGRRFLDRIGAGSRP